MKTSSVIHEAWVSISANPLRTFLAVLGIVIGVSSVVLMLAIGSGSRRMIEESVNKLGTNLIIVSPGSRKSQGVESNDLSNFTLKDVQILSQLPSVVDAAAYTDQRTFQVRSAYGNGKVSIIGTTQSGIAIQSWDIVDGRDLNADDLLTSDRVVVLGNSVATSLFPNKTAVGMNIQINNLSFRVIGLLEAKGQSLDGRNQDNVIFMPITTAQSKLWGYSYWQGIIQNLYVQALSKPLLPQAMEEVRIALRDRLEVKAAKKDPFSLRDLSAINVVASETTRAMSILLGSIASISLIVGGIGIMNIMLVTVSERTREIGIRKAIGASENLILIQFLLEAFFIAGVGSLLGLLVGFGLGILAENYMHVTTYYSMWSILLSLTVASGVGISSGLYPAYKAAKLQPIEALRVS